LARQYQNVLSISMDSSVDPADRLAAADMCNDMAYALARMELKVPAIIRREMPVGLVRKIESLPPLPPPSKEEIDKQNKL
jgi:hypothetical protein